MSLKYKNIANLAAGFFVFGPIKNILIKTKNTF